MALKQSVLNQCLRFQPEPESWEWQKTKKQFRRKIFANTTLCIDPVISFNNYRGLFQPHVRVLYKPYQKLFKKIGFPNNFDYCWNFKVGIYHDAYPLTIKIWKNLPPDSRASWHTVQAVPTLLQTMIDAGSQIFDNELNLSNEEAFIDSMILGADDPRLDDMRYSNNIGLLNQGLLNLMRGNADYIYMMQDRFKQRGGLHLKYVPIIIGLIEDEGLDALLDNLV